MLSEHSIYYGGQGYVHNRGESLIRSNSIEVILLDELESKKLNEFYGGGEEEKQAIK